MSDLLQYNPNDSSSFETPISIEKGLDTETLQADNLKVDASESLSANETSLDQEKVLKQMEAQLQEKAQAIKEERNLKWDEVLSNPRSPNINILRNEISNLDVQCANIDIHLSALQKVKELLNPNHSVWTGNSIDFGFGK